MPLRMTHSDILMMATDIEDPHVFCARHIRPPVQGQPTIGMRAGPVENGHAIPHHRVVHTCNNLLQMYVDRGGSVMVEMIPVGNGPAFQLAASVSIMVGGKPQVQDRRVIRAEVPPIGKPSCTADCAGLPL